MTRQIVFDLETTGFKFREGHRIVEIGAVELTNGALTGRHFHTYVNPERDMPIEAYRVHGLSAEFLSDKPKFAEESVAAAFLAFVDGAELIAHNGLGFDLPFLNAELESANLPRLENSLTDTLLIARRKFPGSPASLDALCSRFGIDTKQRERDGHGALLDSRLLAEVFIELTGGAQAGLNFVQEDDDNSTDRQKTSKRAPARQRPSALRPRICDAERDAHQAFLTELDAPSLWRQ